MPFEHTIPDMLATDWIHRFDAATIARAFPPVTRCANKLAVWAIADGGSAPTGEIACTRWRAPGIGQWQRRTAARVELVPGFFRYAPPAGPSEWHWHVNFANYDLVSAYGTNLLAQDELQVLEHPALASVRHALLAAGASTLCTDGGEPWPILVSGVERRVAFTTAPSSRAPAGLYGNEFARATTEAVEQATTRLAPPTISNILAIEAPACGSGRYDLATITLILRTAAAGFAAAMAHPATTGGPAAATTVIHTGFWGCGAYGGNRELMCLLQCLAAEVAGVDRLVFHCGDDAGAVSAAAALRACQSLPDVPLPKALAAVEALGYTWGVSNGT